MPQLPNSHSDFQSLIEKYRSEMLASYQRKTMADPALEPTEAAVVVQDIEPDFSTSSTFPVSTYAEQVDDSFTMDFPGDEQTALYMPDSLPTMQDNVDTATFGYVEDTLPVMGNSGMYTNDYTAIVEEAILYSEGFSTPLEESLPSWMMGFPMSEDYPVWDGSSEPTVAGIPDFLDDDNAPPPSMLRPRENLPRKPISDTNEDTSPVAVLWDDHSPSPSMLWPHDAAVAVSVYVDEQPELFRASDFSDEECSPSPSMLRPHHFAPEPLLTAMAEGSTTSQPASLQVRVTTARQANPVSHARVTVTRENEHGETMQKFSITDDSGNTSIMSIPSCYPPRPCTIEVSAIGYCRVRYDRVPLSCGSTVIQTVDLIPLPVGEKTDFEIVYDEMMP